MKALHLARAFGASFACVLLGFLLAHAGVVLPLPSASGPTLGDPVTNLYSVVQALQNNTFMNFSSFTNVSQTTAQSTCTQMNQGMNFLTTALGGTGGVCLPQAQAGRNLFVANNTSQTVNVYGFATGLGAGGQDYINGTIGSTAYTGLTNGKNIDCFAPVNGSWWCSAGQ